MNKYTKIVFIRHGEVDNPQRLIYGRTVDARLSKGGFEQIEKLARRFKDENIKPDVIYTSPLTRTRQSADILKEAFSDTKVYIREELLDTDGAVLAKVTLDWLEKNDEYSFPGVEKPKGIIKRIQTER